MASYDYRCPECGALFTVRASFKEKEAGLDPICPACGAADARPVIGPPVLVRAGLVPAAGSLSLPVRNGSCCGGGSCGCG